jgi:hypothetical protein
VNNRLQTAAIIVIVTLFALLIITSLSGNLSIQAQEDTRDADLKIFPPDSKPYGLTYEEWTAKWWQWAYSMPEEGNPMVDDTGEDCANNQAGPVWFLAGTGGGAVTRECTIPSDKGILIPIINVECDSASGSGDTEAVWTAIDFNHHSLI